MKRVQWYNHLSCILFKLKPQIGINNSHYFSSTVNTVTLGYYLWIKQQRLRLFKLTHTSTHSAHSSIIRFIDCFIMLMCVSLCCEYHQFLFKHLLRFFVYFILLTFILLLIVCCVSSSCLKCLCFTDLYTIASSYLRMIKQIHCYYYHYVLLWLHFTWKYHLNF